MDNIFGLDWDKLRKIQKEINSNSFIRSCHEPGVTPIRTIGQGYAGIMTQIEHLVLWLEENIPDWRKEAQLSPAAMQLLEHKAEQKVIGLWAKVPFTFLDVWLNKLTNKEAKVLLAFLRFANINTGLTYVSNKRVAKTAGVGQKRLHESIRGLTDKGFLEDLGMHESGTRIRQVTLSPIYAENGILIKTGGYPQNEG